jgi:hypothetical protein
VEVFVVIAGRVEGMHDTDERYAGQRVNEWAQRWRRLDFLW